ncbi:hypothetical protein RJ639_010293 [Escallonia herrerae]|uniref:Retrotransposon Copia-like N-terminal domain-containing protein n=1 Tax=Escallonia herrerae TaxID=1293975 RepID=A0AA89ARJ6_9ASTE|nr:hypothetical protein RJ639_010293 [Escallonia herrerae]
MAVHKNLAAPKQVDLPPASSGSGPLRKTLQCLQLKQLNYFKVTFHASNHPGHLLVPIKLNGTNYPSWSKSMIHALTAKNKIGFINGSIEQPSEKDQPTEYALWNQCNSMILSWLTHSVEPDLAKGVIHAKTAYQMCEDFKDQFSQKNAPAIYQIQKSLASFSQGTMTVSTYFKKLKGLWDELDTY